MNIARLMKTPTGRLFVKMGEDNAFNWAVIIAWNFLQSLFPIALVMAGVLGASSSLTDRPLLERASIPFRERHSMQ